MCGLGLLLETSVVILALTEPHSLRCVCVRDRHPLLEEDKEGYGRLCGHGTKISGL